MKCLSYNLSWESMTGKNNNWGLCNNNIDPSDKRYYMVCVNNIANLIDKNGIYDFVALQEIANYDILINKSKVLKQMEYHIHKSGREYMGTFWKKKYKLIKIIDGEFDRGRPYSILIFPNFIFINVHLGHYTKYVVYNKLQILLYNIKKTKRIIISGDFNFELNKHFGDKLIINDYIFYINKKVLLTCCSDNNLIKHRYHVDHIIDTYKTPITYTINNDNLLRSDHLPIFGIV